MAKDNPLIANDPVNSVALKVPPKKLTLPLITHLILKGQSEADIARLFGITRQAVNKFVHRYQDDIHELLEGKELEAIRYKAVSKTLLNQVDSARLKKMSGKDLVLSAAICTDKAEQLSGNNQGDKLSFQVQVNIVNNTSNSGNNPDNDNKQ